MTIESARLAGVQTPVIPIVSRWIAETPGTLSLGQGIVSYGPPAEALEAARQRAIGGADHRYGPVEGEADLVAALEAKLAAENHIQVKPHSRVVVTAGGNLAFMNAVLAIADPGDEFILPTPYYFNHEMAITMASARVVGVPTRGDRQLDADAIAAAVTPRTRAVVTVSPNNPTGAVYPESDLRAVNALCARHGLVHIHDEAYEYFRYDDAAHFSPGSIEGAAGHTISLYSFSKAYGMAGWRMGYMVAPAELWEAINKIQDTILICPPAVSQAAARAAIAGGPAYARNALPTLDAMRRLMYERL
ncbi:MAG TPA: aminotransferase class I/II-fold pyridoxal phosphate-dependent enzyme, partial [Vicinamibacterales bacterium]|nr:aminotransferase class I/II-fold pyridoxal phosphate-dependent enzyme [Vicinamibacterales bacterium]